MDPEKEKKDFLFFRLINVLLYNFFGFILTGPSWFTDKKKKNEATTPITPCDEEE